MSNYIRVRCRVMYFIFLLDDLVQAHLHVGEQPGEYDRRVVCRTSDLWGRQPHLGQRGMSADSHRGRDPTPSTRAFLAVRSVIYAEREFTVSMGDARTRRARVAGAGLDSLESGPTLCPIHLAGGAAVAFTEPTGMLRHVTQPAGRSCRACVRLRPSGVPCGFPGAGERRKPPA
jgi:hypothetical protein